MLKHILTDDIIDLNNLIYAEVKTVYVKPAFPLKNPKNNKEVKAGWEMRLKEET